MVGVCCCRTPQTGGEDGRRRRELAWRGRKARWRRRVKAAASPCGASRCAVAHCLAPPLYRLHGGARLAASRVLRGAPRQGGLSAHVRLLCYRGSDGGTLSAFSNLACLGACWRLAAWWLRACTTQFAIVLETTAARASASRMPYCASLRNFRALHHIYRCACPLPAVPAPRRLRRAAATLRGVPRAGCVTVRLAGGCASGGSGLYP